MIGDRVLEDDKPLFDLVHTAPVFDAKWVDDVVALREDACGKGLSSLVSALDHEPVQRLIAGILSGSPHLSGLIKSDLARLERVLCNPAGLHFKSLVSGVAPSVVGASCIEDAMHSLRVFKNEVALLLSLADIGGAWPVMEITRCLSKTAQTALQASVGFLFKSASERGDWLAEDPGGVDADMHGDDSGYIVLGMGKFGAFELNFSSDIDLIVFFDRSRASARLAPKIEAQQFFVRLTRDLVRLMDERTADGYVFRTDLRLRPDPGATHAALSVDAAMIYYESFGQNWERAALIKARPVAGDLDAGYSVLDELQPFIWRKYLDFAAISDIHAMKRQIHSFHGFGDIALPGHNLKLGRGGIREIEFFAQTQQLIAGGRQVALRTRATIETLVGLSEAGWIKPEVASSLTDCYVFLRRIEHRLQMVCDEQTHEMPTDELTLLRFANFCGYETIELLREAIVPVLETVQARFGELFKDDPSPTQSGVRLVFSGHDDDPGTLADLRTMGFERPEAVISAVRSWHHGRYAAVRSAVSRERLTVVQDALVEALADTSDPDGAFASFDRFLSQVPTGVQLFSLLRSKPGLLRLVADVMGSAPRLAQILSRRRRLLDAVIDPRTFEQLPSEKVLKELVECEVSQAPTFEEALDVARVIGGEQSFLLGVRVLSGTINADQAGAAYAVLATSIIDVLQVRVEQEIAATAGVLVDGGAAVIAMGKLGGREMTASSDLDLIVVYDHGDDVVSSDGARPLAPGQYYARMTQRLITALGAPTAEGSLYDVDMRLRPSGQQGPVATRLSSFERYQREEAWTWEQMALVRARVVSGPEKLRAALEGAIAATLVRPRARDKVARDVREMRERIFAEKGTIDIWDLKQVRGGLVDLEFIAQYLQLISAHETPEILDQNTLRAFQNLRDAGLISAAHADVLVPATRLIHNLTQILRICISDRFDRAKAPKGLKELLARAGAAPTFDALEDTLSGTLGDVHRVFDEILGT